MKIITLTGGIASGKSTVCKILEKGGCKIIDTDEIAKNIVKKGKSAWKQIVDHFGVSILKADGELNRIQLSNIIFSNSIEREKLNEITHPQVFNQIKKTIKIIQHTHNNPIIVVDIPLFFEIFKTRSTLYVALVYVNRDIQLKRLIQRDSCSRMEAFARINSQMPIETKQKLASIILDNRGSLENTRKITLSMLEMIKHSNIVEEHNSHFLFDI